MTIRQTAKSPTTAIARVLKGLGLVQGEDFRVKGHYVQGARVGTYVLIMRRTAHQVVADNADGIEELVKLDGGFAFRVSVQYMSDGRVASGIANYGTKTRNAAPAEHDASVTAEEVQSALKAAERQLAGYKTRTGTDLPAPVGASKVHPYEGLAQKRFGALTWACEEALQSWFFQNTAESPRYTLTAYRGRVRSNGWYLTGAGLATEGVWMGPTLTNAALASEDAIFAHMTVWGRLDLLGTEWREGTRVSFLDGRGVRVRATVTGTDQGMVTQAGSADYGRTFIGVIVDSTPITGGTGFVRPFTDQLTRLAGA